MATEYKLSYTASEINERLGMVGNAVLYTEQTMTEEQKEIARKNIGVVDNGISVTAAKLLITILLNGTYNTEQRDNITALAIELLGVELAVELLGVARIDDILYIVNNVTATQNDDTLVIE